MSGERSAKYRISIMGRPVPPFTRMRRIIPMSIEWMAWSVFLKLWSVMIPLNVIKMPNKV